MTTSGAFGKPPWISVRTDADLEVAREVYKLTLSERDAGWVKGPFALCDVPNDAILTRMFGVVQSSWDSQKRFR